MPVPDILEPIVDVAMPQNGEGTVDVSMPQMLEEIVGAIQLVPQEGSHQRIVEQKVLFLVPQVVEDFVVTHQITSQKRISKRIVNQIVDVPMLEVVGEVDFV